MVELPTSVPVSPRGTKKSGPRHWLITLFRWFDNEAGASLEDANDRKIDWLRTVPFIALHVACLAVFWVGVSPLAVGVAVALYVLRMFAITGFYHRYFSHRTFRTSRPVQLLFALLGAAAAQRGPLWWAANHRHHHQNADAPKDIHSPRCHGFLWSHMGWFLCRVHFRTRSELVRDWLKFPELRFLDRYDSLVPALMAAILFAVGEFMAWRFPEWQTDGWQLLVWGFAVSTIVLYHATFTVNSLAHVWGRRRYATRDDSRNNALLAVITLGEGWHNNHHHYPAAARQGFYWWEVDPTYYALRVMAGLGLVWDLRPLPASVRDARQIGSGAAR